MCIGPAVISCHLMKYSVNLCKGKLIGSSVHVSSLFLSYNKRTKFHLNFKCFPSTSTNLVLWIYQEFSGIFCLKHKILKPCCTVILSLCQNYTELFNIFIIFKSLEPYLSVCVTTSYCLVHIKKWKKVKFDF